MPQTYDRIAENYESAIKPLEKWFLKGLRVKLFSSLPAHGRILEIGAGTGLNFPLYPASVNGVATEPSYEMLRVAATKTPRAQIELMQCRAEKLPFIDSSFDAAFATLVFCSVTSQSQAFAELRRVVKKGGKVVLLDHVRPENILGPVADLLSLLTVPLFDDHFNRKTADRAREAGLKILEVEKRGLGIFNLISCQV